VGASGVSIIGLVLGDDAATQGDTDLKHPRTEYRELLIGLVRLHVMHDAAVAPEFGLGIIVELCRHGYRLDPCRKGAALQASPEKRCSPEGSNFARICARLHSNGEESKDAPPDYRQ